MHSFLVAEREYGDYLGLEAKRLKIQVQESDSALPCPALPCPPDLQKDFCLSIQTWFHVSAGCLADHLYFAIIMNKKSASSRLSRAPSFRILNREWQPKMLSHFLPMS